MAFFQKMYQTKCTYTSNKRLCVEKWGCHHCAVMTWKNVPPETFQFWALGIWPWWILCAGQCTPRASLKLVPQDRTVPWQRWASVEEGLHMVKWMVEDPRSSGCNGSNAILPQKYGDCCVNDVSQTLTLHYGTPKKLGFVYWNHLESIWV